MCTYGSATFGPERWQGTVARLVVLPVTSEYCDYSTEYRARWMFRSSVMSGVGPNSAPDYTRCMNAPGDDRRI